MSEGERLRPGDFLKLELRDPGFRFRDLRGSLGASALVHALVLVALVVPWARHLASNDTDDVRPNFEFVWHVPGGEGEGGGGGGGGSGGEKPTSFIRARIERPEERAAEPEPRQALVAPLKHPPLRAESLDVPDTPSDFFLGPPSPQAVDYPGLSLTDLANLGGIDTERSAGRGGGIGGGTGTGVGTGQGWGVGPGRGGGTGGGEYRPGAWDVDPRPIFEPDPQYPPEARRRLVTGEVILEILVRIDGSTEVRRVIKSLPYGCVEAAVEAALLYRWKPALKKGKPVDAVGMLTVTFDLFAQKKGKG
jgi:protein TonB